MFFQKQGVTQGCWSKTAYLSMPTTSSCSNCCLLSVAMVKWWQKTDTKKETIFSEQIYKKGKKKKKAIGDREVMGKSRESLRDFKGFPEPFFHLPFLAEGPFNPLKARLILCSVTPMSFFYNQLHILLNCKHLKLQFTFFPLLLLHLHAYGRCILFLALQSLVEILSPSSVVQVIDQEKLLSSPPLQHLCCLCLFWQLDF